MADATYRTRQGDVLDAICLAYYGRTDGRIVEQVLDANPGLAALGPVYAAGVLITLPAAAAPEARQTGVRLWE